MNRGATSLCGDLIRGEQVRHISPDMVGATRGSVLATFLDADGEPVAAVQWDGGSIAVFRLKWLDRAGPVQSFARAAKNRGQVSYLDNVWRSA